MTRSVFVTGHVRSGTSMVAGLLAAHGVFFGACHGPSKRVNARGFLENRWLKRTVEAGGGDGWPASWRQRLSREGWDGVVPWGAKLMPMHWPLVRRLDLTVVVCCWRDERSILASSERVGWKRTAGTVADRRATMWRLRGETDATVLDVYTPDVIDGRYGPIECALALLDIAFSSEVADAWVDPDLWHFR